MWKSHPANLNIQAPCTTNGTSNFTNQCAIQMGVCLQKSGVPLTSFTGARCYPGHGHNQSHILRAQELADWIKSKPGFFGRATIRPNTNAQPYKDKTGIIFCKNFYGTNNQGDHIDLWDGKRMTLGSVAYFSLSQEVWFWEIS